MKKTLLLLLCLSSISLIGQTSYDHRITNYSKFTDGGDIFDHNSDEVGLWANTGNKQVVAWRNFTDDGTIGGNAVTMETGDSFEITLNATRAFGQIGIALLASPTTTSSWADRHNNYAVQVNLNGIATPNWEVISTGGTSNLSTVDATTTYADIKFTFSLTSATEMTVSISKNNATAETFPVIVNNTNITGYAVYLADDWNGSANANIYLKPNTSFNDVSVLNTSTIKSNNQFYVFENTLFFNSPKNRTIKIYSLNGALLKSYNSNQKSINMDIQKGMYAIKTISDSTTHSTLVLIK